MPKGGTVICSCSGWNIWLVYFFSRKSARIGLKQSISIPGSRHTQPCTASGSLYRQSPADTIFFTPLMVTQIFHFLHKSLVNGYDGEQLLQLPFQILL